MQSSFGPNHLLLLTFAPMTYVGQQSSSGQPKSACLNVNLLINKVSPYLSSC